MRVLDNDDVGLVPNRATVNGTTLVLTYNEILDSASTPYPFHFYVTVDDSRPGQRRRVHGDADARLRHTGNERVRVHLSRGIFRHPHRVEQIN